MAKWRRYQETSATAMADLSAHVDASSDGSDWLGSEGADK